MWTPLFVVVVVGCGGFCLDKLEYLKVLYHGSANLVFTLSIALKVLKKASLARLRPVIYLSSAFYTQTKPTSAFSVNATYVLSLLLTSNSESCSFLTIALVTSMFWSAI